MANLTDKQERFCQEYLVDLNATQAAIRAGYSNSTARQIGADNLSKVDIQARVSELNKSRLEATGISQKRVLEEYAKIAFFDIRKVYGVDGALLPISQLGYEEAAVIAGVKTTEIIADDMIIGNTKEVKVFDKIRALQDLGKHLGLFEKDNSQKVEPAKQVIVINGKEVEF